MRILSFMIKQLSIVSLLFLLISCEKKVEVTFKITVKDDKNLLLPNAIIKIDGEQIGTTNELGVWVANIMLPEKSEKKLEISKASKDFYYALDTTELKTTEVPMQKFDYVSVLYSVPKPSSSKDTPQEIKNSVTQTNAINQEVDIPAPSQPSTTTEKTPELENKNAVENKIAVETKEMKTSEDLVPQNLDYSTSMIPIGKEQSSSTGVKDQIFEDMEQEIITTIYVHEGKKQIANAKVSIGINSETKGGCETNTRGRCVLRFPSAPKNTVNLIVQKDGYLTQNVETRITDKGTIKFNLIQGHTIEINALSKSFQYEHGIENIEVYVGGKKSGITDKQGRFFYAFPGKIGDFLEIKLKSKNYLPEEFETDFVVSGPLTLQKYFMPKDPPKVKVVFLNVQPAGKAYSDLSTVFNQELNDRLNRAAKNNIFSSNVFEAVPVTTFIRHTKESNLPISQLIKFGWNDTALKSIVDIAILPVIIMEEKPTLELSLIDANGNVLVAANEKLVSLKDQVSIDNAVNEITKNILRKFPFEGLVLEKTNHDIKINLGHISGRQVRPGDEFEVWGTQTGKQGDLKEFKSIARLEVKSVTDHFALASILNLEPRSIIERGDQVILTQKNQKQLRGQSENSDDKNNNKKSFNNFIQVVSKSNGIETGAVKNANVYFNELWIGSTDKNGRIYINHDQKKVGMLKIVKHGYSIYKESFDASQMSPKVELKQETAFVRIETKPNNAIVKVDGVNIGKTPINYPIPIPSGFAKLEISGVPGYKTYSQVLELDQGTLELTGSRAIELELDVISESENFIKQQNFDLAIKKLEEISETHSDFLIAKHKLGELYLTQKKNFAQAATTFAMVTSHDSVSNFNDKRFIGTFINEAIALYQTGESLLLNDKEAAIAHFKKSIEVLNKVSPYTRFIADKQALIAENNLEYYKGLNLHKIWNLTQDHAVLEQAKLQWEKYLNQKDSQPETRQNAEIYLKQANNFIQSEKGKL